MRQVGLKFLRVSGITTGNVASDKEAWDTGAHFSKDNELEKPYTLTIQSVQTSLPKTEG